MPATTADEQFTRCPQCATVFRVTAVQLAAREGQVRCGRCHRIFDATASLHAAAAPAEAAGDTAVAKATMGAEAEENEAVGIAGAVTHDVETTAAPVTVGAQQDAPFEHGAAPVQDALAEQGAPPQQDALAEQDAPPPQDALAEQGEPPQQDAAPEQSAVSVRNALAEQPVLPERAAPHLQSAVSTQDAPEPVAAALRPKGRGRSLVFGFAIPVLIGLLAMQAAVHFRDSLASHWPQTSPALTQMCEILGCTLQPLHEIGYLSIEASDLQADPAHKGLLILSATVRNRAPYALAYPYLELTLTDAQDQPVVRRALAPKEYAGGTADVDAGVAANAELAVKLFIDASASSQVGYRLYLFYP